MLYFIKQLTKTGFGKYIKNDVSKTWTIRPYKQFIKYHCYI